MMKSYKILAIGLVLFSCQPTQDPLDTLDLNAKLGGSWKASAFSGELHEFWALGKDGWMQQQGYYIEKRDTSYSATTRIEKVDDAIILFSVIKNSNPKIFKAVKIDDSELIFENKDYKNPFRVHYKFIDNTSYHRTITGYENDSLVRYEFRFKKQLN